MKMACVLVSSMFFALVLALEWNSWRVGCYAMAFFFWVMFLGVIL